MIGAKLGKFTILGAIGSGSMGTVYKAEDPTSGGQVAIKLVKSRILYDAGRRERFLQGLLAASEIRHAGICPILEIGDYNDDFFVVMPFLEGETLSRHMAGSPMPWKEALGIALPVGEALAAGHAAGAIHRGLKPANVWLGMDGRVLVMDFGLARFTEIGKSGKVSSGQQKMDFADTIIPMSALGYMSPEQVRGGLVDYRSDIFSFGAMLYVMLTGVHPFESRNSLARMHAILEADPPPVGSRGTPLPGEMNRILKKALAKSPDDRYRNMEEILAELRHLRDHGQAPKPDQPGNSASHPVKSRYPLKYLLAPLLLVLAAALVYFLWMRFE